MKFLPFRRLFRISGRLGDVERDLDAELAFHFRTCVEELTKSGMSEAEARQHAEERFGDKERYRRELRRLDRQRFRKNQVFHWLDIVRQDVRYAVRGVRRAPLFSLGVALTFSLGVGANATMFGVVDRILLQPPKHVTEPDALRRLYLRRTIFNGSIVATSAFTYPDYLDFTQASTFSTVASYINGQATIGTGSSAFRTTMTGVTSSFFPLLGISPVLGRRLLPEDEQAGATPVTLLSYEIWQREFAGDSSILGQTLVIDDRPTEVIGILPRGFTGVDLHTTDIWLAMLQSPSADDWRDARGWWGFAAIGRLGPLVTDSSASAEATALHRNARSGISSYDPEAVVFTAPIQMARGPRASSESVVAKWLAGVSIIVLIIASANVANLLLARGAQRHRELGIRVALGVGRTRLMTQLITEGVVLAACGGIGALLIVSFGSRAVGNILVPNVSWDASVADLRVLGFTLATTVFAGIFAGLIPAWQMTRQDVHEALREGAGHSTRRSLTRTTLLIAQGALCVVLLVGAGLFVKSLRSVLGVDLGFDPSRVALIQYNTGTGTLSRAEVEQAYNRGLERAITHPGVESAALTSMLPFNNSISVSLRVPGLDSLPTFPGGGPYIHFVSPSYFDVMDMAIVRGRGFQPSDVGGAPVAWINQAMAKGIWPSAEALGQCLIIGTRDDQCTSVVGIVEDSRRQQVIEDSELLYYLPRNPEAPQHSTRGIVARTAGDVNVLAESLRRALADELPTISYVTARTYNELVDPNYRSWRLGATMFTAFGGLALLVASIGLYSVLAYDVSTRTRELGIRTALGAPASRVVRLIVSYGVKLAVTGAALGLVAAFFASPLIESLLFEVNARDPVVFGLVGLTLILVAITASALPAARATRIAPTEALRQD